MVEHLVDYFNNLAKRNKEINNIQSIIDGSEKKEKNMKDYIAELETELKKNNGVKTFIRGKNQ